MSKILKSDERDRMDALVAGIPTKSAKIRRLDQAGYARADIARFLDIRYQHVRNVLVAMSTGLGKSIESVGSGTSSGDRSAMEEIVAGLPTKSARIRALDAAGYARADIARYLGVRYQHVYNVLRQPAPRALSGRIDAAGRIVIPAAFRQALNVGPGDEVTLRLDEDEVRIFSAAGGVRRAQQRVARYAKDERSWVDELIAERRREAERELPDE